MLFDLKGRRRRVVQVTYVGLAILMGGGLVLAGIGSDASGGLLNALVGDGDSSSDDDIKNQYEDQIEAADKQLATNAKDPDALVNLVRANFQLAVLEQDETTGEFSSEGKERLNDADAAWTRYLTTDPQNIDTGLVAIAFQLYSETALADTQKQKRPAQIIAEQQNTSDAYVTLVAIATKAGDTRLADLAGRKAISLAETKDDKASVKEQVEQAKQSAAGAGGGTDTAQPPAGDG
jgi:hypothetical protein